jgi:hypothetical protein
MNGRHEGGTTRCATTGSIRLLASTILIVSVLAAMSGCVISPRRTGDGGTSPTPTPTVTPVPGAAGKLYVSNQNGNSIFRFDNALTVTGNIQPAAAIFGSNTGLNLPQSIAIDPAADRLFVANSGGSSVLVWDGISTLSGNIAPTRSISGLNTGLLAPVAVAIDSTRDLLYVADQLQGQVVVFSPASTAGTNTIPTRALAITGANLSGMALDTANDRLFISDTAGDAIGIFDNVSMLNGPVTSNRAISGPDTGLAGPTGLTLDLFGDLVVSNGNNGTITVYSNAGTAANGDVRPSVVIQGGNTRLVTPGQVILNPANSANEIYVADSTAQSVTTFTGVNSSGGNIAPARNLSGGSTTFNGPRGVALDVTR